MTPQAPPAVSDSLLARFLATSLFALLCVALAAPAAAEITSSGSINPSPLGNAIASGTLLVGDENAASPSPLGRLNIDSGSVFQRDQLIIADDEESLGRVVVTGVGSTLRLVGTSTSNEALIVGHEGSGWLDVTDGALLDVSNLSTSNGNDGSVTIGRDATSSGRVTIDGAFTEFIVGDNLIVGEDGFGEFNLTGGAIAYGTDIDDGAVTVGATATGAGVVTVDGAATYWQLPQTTTIGAVGSGEFRVRGGATVDAAHGLTGAAFTVGDNGLVELSGGANLLTDGATITGHVGGDGRITGAVTVSPGGELFAGPGETLRVVDAAANTGLVKIAGVEGSRAEVEFVSAVTNTDPGGANPPGRIAVGYGVVRFDEAFTNNGTLSSTSGQTDFHGAITNGAAGLIAVGGQSNATFFDNVDITAGTLSIAAGSTALFMADITISPGVNLSITLDESSQTDGFDTPLQVAGQTELNTPVSLVLADGFVPAEGDVFPLIDAAGGLSIGVIDPNNFEDLPTGLTWQVQLSDTGVSAVVVPDGGINPGGGLLDGDYDGNDVVDRDDYLFWRDNYGATSGPGLAADGNGDGVVDAADYTIWRDRLGDTNIPLAGAGSTAAPTPEPSAIGLVTLAGFWGLSRRRSRLAG